MIEDASTVNAYAMFLLPLFAVVEGSALAREIADDIRRCCRNRRANRQAA